MSQISTCLIAEGTETNLAHSPHPVLHRDIRVRVLAKRPYVYAFHNLSGSEIEG